MNPGEKIQYLRKNLLRWNQKRFAREVTTVSKTKGLYQELISKYETGKEPIKTQHLEAFALFFAKRYRTEVTKQDLETGSLMALKAKLLGNSPETALQEIADPGVSAPSPLSRKMFPIPIILISLIVLIYFLFMPGSPTVVRIDFPNNAQILPYDNIPVHGMAYGSRKGYSLWLFIEKQGTFFWPKSEVDVFQEVGTSDSLSWEREIYHHPSPADSTLYGEEFSISLMVIPRNKLYIIKNWFDTCKEIGHYPPLDLEQVNEIIAFRRSMVSDLRVEKE